MVLSKLILDAVQGWWVWYLWICPVFWSCWGLISTQLGDLTDSMKVQDGTVTQVGHPAEYINILVSHAV